MRKVCCRLHSSLLPLPVKLQEKRSYRDRLCVRALQDGHRDRAGCRTPAGRLDHGQLFVAVVFLNNVPIGLLWRAMTKPWNYSSNFWHDGNAEGFIAFCELVAICRYPVRGVQNTELYNLILIVPQNWCSPI